MKSLVAGILLAFFFPSVYAQSQSRKEEFNLTRDGVAIKGYDPVAYFTEGRALKGSKEWAVYANGVTYYFSSLKNKEKFRENYTAYEPQYGGWCAYAMGNDGDKVSIDPETFKIVDGKLYLFYHSWSVNTLTKWNRDEANLKKKADLNWKKYNP